MKRFTRFSWAFICSITILLLSLSSCKKSNNKNPNPNNPNTWNDGTLSATIAGTNWTATSVYAVDSAQMVFIVAATNNVTTGLPAIILSFPDNIAEGATVDFNVTQYSWFQYLESSTAVYWAEPSMGGAGSVTISKFNKGSKRVEGTFNATMKSANVAATKSLTNGQFAINYR